jgi:hypothetical protein
MDQDMPEVSSDCSRPVLHSPVSAPCLPFPGGYTANGFVREKPDLETRVAPSPRAGTGLVVGIRNKVAAMAASDPAPRTTSQPWIASLRECLSTNVTLSNLADVILNHASVTWPRNLTSSQSFGAKLRRRLPTFSPNNKQMRECLKDLAPRSTYCPSSHSDKGVARLREPDSNIIKESDDGARC